jgi:hypothetical protein
MKFSSCVTAALALSFVAFGQNPKDDDENEVEVQVMAPEVEAIQLDGADDLVNFDHALGSLILGVEGQATQDEKDSKKARSRSGMQDEKDAKKGVIEREIDLGGGRTMKIIISGGGPEGRMRAFNLKGSEGGLRPLIMKAPDGMPRGTGPGVHVFKGEMNPPAGAHDPHGFRVEVGGRDMKEHVDRAMRAFERAREEFIRAFKEGEAGGPPAKAPHAWKVEGIRPFEGRITIGEGEEKGERKEKAEKIEKREGEEKGEKPEPKRFRISRPEVQMLGVAPGAAQKREIDELRKEIKELEKMVRDLKDQIGPKLKDEVK